MKFRPGNAANHVQLIFSGDAILEEGNAMPTISLKAEHKIVKDYQAKLKKMDLGLIPLL